MSQPKTTHSFQFISQAEKGRLRFALHLSLCFLMVKDWFWKFRHLAQSSKLLHHGFSHSFTKVS